MSDKRIPIYVTYHELAMLTHLLNANDSEYKGNARVVTKSYVLAANNAKVNSNSIGVSEFGCNSAIATGAFTMTASAAIGETLFYITDKEIRDRVFDGDAAEGSTPYTHLLCKVIGGDFFWLRMVVDNPSHEDPMVDYVTSKALALGDNCYIIGAVRNLSFDV